MKVIIRGSSITSGYGVESGYADLLKDRIEMSSDVVIGRSKNKETSFDGVRTYDNDIGCLSPELLILHFGIDDAFHPVYRSEFKENLVQIVRKARVDGIPFISLMTSHPLPDNYEMDTMEIYYRTIREVALDLHCRLIPIHLFWYGFLEDTKLSLKDLLLEDSRYPNRRGHQLYSEIVCDTILRIKESLQ
jgi:lysophospholipase L1-like esterase